MTRRDELEFGLNQDCRTLGIPSELDKQYDDYLYHQDRNHDPHEYDSENDGEIALAEQPCSICKGSGLRFQRYTCSACNGTGVVML